MIAVSLKEGDDIVELLLKKEADVNAKSKSPDLLSVLLLISGCRFQQPGTTQHSFIVRKVII
jgi:hypothetical protein